MQEKHKDSTFKCFVLPWLKFSDTSQQSAVLNIVLALDGNGEGDNREMIHFPLQNVQSSMSPRNLINEHQTVKWVCNF